MNPTINMVKWSKVRILAKDRDRWMCCVNRECRKRWEARGRPYQACHVRWGISTTLDNLQTLDSRGCHIAKSRIERRAARPVDPRIQAWRDLISSRIDAMV